MDRPKTATEDSPRDMTFNLDETDWPLADGPRKALSEKGVEAAKSRLPPGDSSKVTVDVDFRSLFIGTSNNDLTDAD
jgi:hypothetical protein